MKTIAALALAAALPAVVAGCGGDDGGGDDPEALLERAFSNDETISSGVIDLTVDLAAEGATAGSFTAAVTGPFQSDPEDPNGLPQLDLEITASGEGAAAQAVDGFEAGLLITEDNLFVDYGGTTYELGTETFTMLEEQSAAQAETAEGEDAASSFRDGCEQAIEAQGGDPAACDFDVTAWFGELSNEGTEDLGGSEVTHIAGQLNVETMVTDLFELGSSIPGATGGVDPALIQPSLDAFGSAISDASFDVYPATEDETLRGLGFDLAVDPTAIPGGEAVGIDSANLGFSFEISDVGSEQTFEAPTNAEPIADLLGQFGGALPGGTVPGLPGGSGLPGGGTGTIDPQCLQDAGSDPDAIQACLE